MVVAQGTKKEKSVRLWALAPATWLSQRQYFTLQGCFFTLQGWLLLSCMGRHGSAAQTHSENHICVGIWILPFTSCVTLTGDLLS